MVRNWLIVVATSVAGEFFSRITTLLRCRTSPSSSFVRIASTMFRSAIVPEAITLLVRVSTPNRNGTSEVSLLLEVFCSNCMICCGPAAVPVACPVKSVLSMSERFCASPLTMVKTLIWASAAGRLSNCRTRPSSKSRFSGGEEITKALARTSGVMTTPVRIPEFSSFRPLASTVRKRSMAARCSFCPRPCSTGGILALTERLSAWRTLRSARLSALAELAALLSALSALAGAGGRDPDRRLHDRGDVLGERMFQPNDAHLVDRPLVDADDVDLPNQFGNLGHVAGAGLDDQRGGPRDRP